MTSGRLTIFSSWYAGRLKRKFQFALRHAAAVCRRLADRGAGRDGLRQAHAGHGGPPGTPGYWLSWMAVSSFEVEAGASGCQSRPVQEKECAQVIASASRYRSISATSYSLKTVN